MNNNENMPNIRTIRKNRLEIWPNTKSTLKNAKVYENCTKVSKFYQLWSHWSWSTLVDECKAKYWPPG